MRLIVSLLLLGCIVSLSSGQWVETTVPLPDSMPGIREISVMQYHPTNHIMYVAGGYGLLAVDLTTRQKTARIELPGTPYFLCSSTTSNKLYCARNYDRTVWVVDCATNSPLATVTVDSAFRDMCYAGAVNKVYVACSQANAVDVIDCETDSIVARIGPLPGASAVCYNPILNRVYSTQSGSDEVAVIDCSADTVIRTIWVRGVLPNDICYDSVTNCVYAANRTSSTVSIIDCGGDTLAGVVPVGDEVGNLLVGSQGKVYCSADDSVLNVIHGGVARAISMGSGQYGPRLSYDPQSDKVYWSGSDFESDVVIIDGVGDSVLSRIGRSTAGIGPRALCYDPVGNGTWEVSRSGGAVGVIDGTTDQITDVILLGVIRPGQLRYNHLNNRLYCLARGYGDNSYLAVIDGNANRLLKILPEDLPAGYSIDSMLWNPANNKVYLSSSRYNTVTIVDCASDSVVATIGAEGEWPKAMCCSNNGKVYVVNERGSVSVIDPIGDTVREVIPVSDGTPNSICYGRTDDKVYVGKWRHDQPVSVIDASTDSIVASLLVGVDYQCLVWDRNHDKVYVYTHMDSSLAVIGCERDTVLRIMKVPDGMRYAYSDSLSDRVYFANNYNDRLMMLDPGVDTFYRRELTFNGDGFMIDNGRSGAANRLYCTDYWGVTVVATIPRDTVLRSIRTGEGTNALAWNPTHSWVYVSNSDSGGITVVRDTLPVGVAEGSPQALSHEPRPTVVKGVLELGAGSRQDAGYRAVLLDAAGRKVLDLQPGANDVSRLSPGVYFVREAQAQAQAVRRVVITK